MRVALKLIMFVPFLFLVSCAEKSISPEEKDSYLWLEDVEGQKALNWVGEQNKQTLAQMTPGKRYKSLKKSALNLLEAKDNKLTIFAQ